MYSIDWEIELMRCIMSLIVFHPVFFFFNLTHIQNYSLFFSSILDSILCCDTVWQHRLSFREEWNEFRKHWVHICRVYICIVSFCLLSLISLEWKSKEWPHTYNSLNNLAPPLLFDLLTHYSLKSSHPQDCRLCNRLEAVGHPPPPSGILYPTMSGS